MHDKLLGQFGQAVDRLASPSVGATYEYFPSGSSTGAIDALERIIYGLCAVLIVTAREALRRAE